MTNDSELNPEATNCRTFAYRSAELRPKPLLTSVQENLRDLTPRRKGAKTELKLKLTKRAKFRNLLDSKFRNQNSASL
jgi:hypothetical protein